MIARFCQALLCFLELFFCRTQRRRIRHSCTLSAAECQSTLLLLVRRSCFISFRRTDCPHLIELFHSLHTQARSIQTFRLHGQILRCRCSFISNLCNILLCKFYIFLQAGDFLIREYILYRDEERSQHHMIALRYVYFLNNRRISRLQCALFMDETRI